MRAAHLLLASLVLPLAGCATFGTPQVDVVAPVPWPVQPPAVAATTGTPGAIYQAGFHRPLFEDRRAQRVGDLLTIQIEEVTSASQQSTTEVDRNASIGASFPALPFASARLLGRLGAEASSAVSSSGEGKTNSSNTFKGVIAVQVQQVLPNGHLLVAGDKQIGVNQNVDVMRFSGVVDPSTIRGGNVVSSAQVGQARLEQRGRGDVGRVQGLGWLSRFFLSIAPV